MHGTLYITTPGASVLILTELKKFFESDMLPSEGADTYLIIKINPETGNILVSDFHTQKLQNIEGVKLIATVQMAEKVAEEIKKIREKKLTTLK